MQLFPCPFCGPRDETEFRFGADAGNARPEPALEPALEVGAETWSAYLHEAANPKGRAREVWVHLTCGEFFVMERDTVTHEVFGAEALP